MVKGNGKMESMKIGIKLYTVREALKADYRGVLRELAKLGCEGVEFAGNFGGMEPAELTAFLRETGLACCGIHASAAELADPAARVYDYAEALGARYVTFSHCGKYPGILDECIRECAAAGKTAASKGLGFTYHNHACEFAEQDGIPCLDRILAATDPQKVGMELDVCWAAKAGADPVEYIGKYRNRLPQIHMKDFNPADGSFTELGSGCVDLAACAEAAKESACKWLIYEQDACARPPLESAGLSIAFLRKLLNR